MTSEEQVRAVLEARYFDLRNILAERLKQNPDDEVVDCVAEWTVCKCLRLAPKYDPVKGAVWGWVLMIAWSQLQRLYRSNNGNGVKVKGVKRDALEHSVAQAEEAPERPSWPIKAEEDYIITVIDLKKGGGHGR